MAFMPNSMDERLAMGASRVVARSAYTSASAAQAMQLASMRPWPSAGRPADRVLLVQQGKVLGQLAVEEFGGVFTGYADHAKMVQGGHAVPGQGGQALAACRSCAEL